MGNVYSYCVIGSRLGRVDDVPNKILKPYQGGTSPYLLVGLSKNGETKSKLVHRLVAEAFIPNPEQLPEIDHIDNNPLNNCVENLQWVDRNTNIAKMLEHSTPLRNYKIVCLRHDANALYFISIHAAATYAEHYGASKSSLIKYKKSRGWVIESVSTIPEGSSIRDENGYEVVPEFGYKY